MRQRFDGIIRRAAPWLAALALVVATGLVPARAVAAQQTVTPAATAAPSQEVVGGEASLILPDLHQIGRASCRERV